MSRRLPLVFAIAGLLLTGHPGPMARAEATEGRCFVETGKCVVGSFLHFWEEQEGLAQQGLPLTDEFAEVNAADGLTYTVQYFERARFEHHRGRAAPNDVLLGLLGVEQYTSRYGDTPLVTTPLAAVGDCRDFPATGKQACGPFLRYWDQHGGLAQQGQPRTAVFWEINPADGKRYQVQYFERARFEYHPENAAPSDVLLGLLGREAVSCSLRTRACPRRMGRGPWNHRYHWIAPAQSPRGREKRSWQYCPKARCSRSQRVRNRAAMAIPGSGLLLPGRVAGSTEAICNSVDRFLPHFPCRGLSRRQR